MNIAVEGCSHGELDIIYAAVEHAQAVSGNSIDLLICCGDFQSVRNPGDLRCMAAPLKYLSMQTFYKYYSGEKKAPVLTIFIGGNHEASNYLQELPYGGWVAPDIYYLGYGGVVNVGGLRIGGLSGIYKGPDYLKGRFERPPYSESSIRSVYHVRNLEVFRMKQLDQTGTPLDIFVSHDWPRGVTKFGDADKLCRQKQFFKEEVEQDSLGSKPAQELLHHLQPRYWFAGHLHVKFVALVDHCKDSKEEENNTQQISRFTRFMALDKCLPKREFLQVLNIKYGHHRYQNIKIEAQGLTSKTKDSVSKPDSPGEQADEEKSLPPSTPNSNILYSYSPRDDSGCFQLHHDLEWLTVLRLTDHLLQVVPGPVYMPGPGHSERYNFTPAEEDMRETLRLMNNDLRIRPGQFCRTVEAFDPERDAFLIEHLDTMHQPQPTDNPYTQDLCEKLGIRDPMAELLRGTPGRSPFATRTPRATALLSEADLTLDTSRFTINDEAPNSDGESDSPGDIVFEVSISDSTDGTSKGVLSPVITPARSSSRKLVMSNSPLSDAAQRRHSGSSESPSANGAAAVCTDPGTQDSSVAETSSQSADAEEPLLSPRPKRSSLCLSLPLNDVAEDTVVPIDTLTTGAAANDVADVQQSSNQQPAPKPTKIRRRNAALYAHDDE